MSDNKDFIGNEDDIIDEEDTNEETKNDEYEDVCYLCKRTESRAGKMMSIPGNICICSDCMQKTLNSFSARNKGRYYIFQFCISVLSNYHSTVCFYEFNFFRFHIYVRSHSICLSVSGLFHLA